MSKRTAMIVGAVGGFLFGAVMFLQDPRPLVCVVLGAPLILVCKIADSMHATPRESLVPLFFIVPTWFIYWTALGGIFGRLAWWGCRRIAEKGRRDNGPA